MLSLKSMNLSFQGQINRSVRTGVAVNDQILSDQRSARFSKTQIAIFNIILAIIVGFILMAFMQKLIVRTGYEIDHHQQELVELYQSNDHLRLDVAKLKSPSRIQAIATKELGMAMPQTFIYSSDKAAVVESKAVATEKFKD